MKPKKNSYPAVNIGSSFMLVILIILSMVIFAVLSLSGALRDARYIERKAGRTANYYQANNTAEKILADIDQVLAETCEKAELFTEEYQTEAIEELNQLDHILASPAEGAEPLILIEYSVLMGGSDALEITLAANDSRSGNDGYYYITEWTQISTQEWNADSTLPVIKAN